eukprot:78883-Amphidinium_carterae.2
MIPVYVRNAKAQDKDIIARTRKACTPANCDDGAHAIGGLPYCVIDGFTVEGWLASASNCSAMELLDASAPFPWQATPWQKLNQYQVLTRLRGTTIGETFVLLFQGKSVKSSRLKCNRIVPKGQDSLACELRIVNPSSGLTHPGSPNQK